MGDELDARALGDVRAEIGALAHWLLGELDRQRQITHVLEREGDRLSDVRRGVRDGISERGYRIGSALVERWLPDLDAVQRDAFAVAAIGAIINFRRSTWTFGAPPRDLTDDDFVGGWIELISPYLDRLR